MSKRFEHFGIEWTAASSGWVQESASFGTPPVTRHEISFRSAWGEFDGVINKRELADASDEELRSALVEELERRVLNAIQHSRYTWRPAEAISKETNIPLAQVRHVLEHTTAADVISGPQNKQGLLLYTTKDHFVQTGGDVMRRYVSTEESS